MDTIHEKILSSLNGEKKPLMIREISEKCGIHRQTIARNLDVMELLGLVRKIEIGNAKKYYQINTLPISALIDFASDLIIIINPHHVIEYINKP